MKSTNQTGKFEEKIAEAINNAFKRNFDELYEEYKNKMIEDMDSRKDEILAGLTLNLMKHISLQTFGTELRITLDTKALSQKQP